LVDQYIVVAGVEFQIGVAFAFGNLVLNALAGFGNFGFSRVDRDFSVVGLRLSVSLCQMNPSWLCPFLSAKKTRAFFDVDLSTTVQGQPDGSDIAAFNK